MNTLPRIIPRSEHSISRSQIDKGVLDILYTLSREGYEAYLVGGGLRDLLLGLEPKDFDVVTNATPEQIRSTFRSRCRIIGRRFRLAHVHVGNKIIEVATFRAHSDEQGDRLIDKHGMVKRDNVFGSRDEDVWRRDFTINALYYNIDDFSLIDYVGAIEDLAKGHIRLIGDPAVRYREDPVRMIRAVRFACKLGLDLPPETAEPLPKLAYLLGEASPARLYEEVLKLFFGGQGSCVFERLMQHGLLEALFEQTDLSLTEPNAQSRTLIPAGLTFIDCETAQGKRVSPALLFALLLWEPLLERLTPDANGQLTDLNALIKHSQLVLNEQNLRTSIPKPVVQVVREIWAFQLPLQYRPEKAHTMAQHPRFALALLFLRLRAQVMPELQAVVDFWTEFLAQNPSEPSRQLPANASEEAESTPQLYQKRRRRPYHAKSKKKHHDA